ncbi:MAG: class I SAM-dependent methyltransferase [Chitinophagaceae bacterium]
MASFDSKQRFSDRVEDYLRYRPDYPSRIPLLLQEEIGFSSQWKVADIGSGTGICTELFLRQGNLVYGVEPNPEMSKAAKSRLAAYPNFIDLEGSAEETGLPDGSIDLILVAQAFHWFDAQVTKKEFSRIITPSGFVVLIWNERRTDTAFLKGYESLVRQYATDYAQVDHRQIGSRQLQEFFGPHLMKQYEIEHQQQLNLEGLQGRLLSSSYMPRSPHPVYKEMIRNLEALFDRHQQKGGVTIFYTTKIYVGKLED